MVEWVTFSEAIEYREAMEIMEKRVGEVMDRTSPETVYLLEHKEVYTAGSNAKVEELLSAKGVPVVYTGRGGKFTYHAPGQRIIYPIINLANSHRKKDLRLYVHSLEEWIIATLAEFGIKGKIAPERVGIWVEVGSTQKKIAAIGVRVRKWVTYHGIAVNIFNDLSGYSGIIPCGLKNFGVTSMLELGVPTSFEVFDSSLKKEFNKIFG